MGLKEGKQDIMEAEYKICLKYLAKKRRKTSVGARKETGSDKDFF